MPLASVSDYTTISGWSLSTEFANRRNHLIDIAKIGYGMLAGSGLLPQPSDCEDTIRLLIHGSAEFNDMMQVRVISYDFVIWDMLSGCLARILLDEEFHAISH